MTKKYLISVILLTLLYTSTYAQQGILKGKVSTVNGQPVEFVNVGLIGTNKGSVSNKTGDFEIKNIKPGTYSVFASRIGSNKQIQQVTIEPGEIKYIEFTLNESAEELNEVTIQGERINPFYRDSSFIIAKMPLKDLENPQVYNVVTARLMNEQVVTNLNDALKNATGVSRLWESTGRGGDGAEFFSLRGFAVQPTLVNGMPSINNGGLDPANVETIEVIKGPSGTLFGSALIAYGGLINITTKKPFETYKGNVGIVNGSNGLNRFTADVNIPLNDRVFSRINAAYHQENSFQDAGFQKSIFIAPSFTIRTNDRLTFLINTEFLNKESANAPMLFFNRNTPLTFSDIKVFENKYEQSFTSNDLTMRNPSLGLQAQALYKLSDKWTSQTVLSSSKTKTNGYYHYLFYQNNVNAFVRYISKRNGETNITDVQQNFIGAFNIGKLENKITIGFDYFQSNILNSSTGWVSNGNVTIEDGEDTGILTQSGVDDLLANSFEGNSTAKQQIVSVYATDVINITPKLSALASVRYDRFQGQTAYWQTQEVESQYAISPKFGLVFQPIINKVSLFANYQNGFTNVAPTEVSDIDGSNTRLKTFDPENANQMEWGVKTNLMNNKLSLTASYYDIVVKNRVTIDPENPNNSIQGGEVESKGFEVSLIANPINGLNIITGFSKNDSEVTKDFPGDYIGLRPEEAGPAQLANAWISYTFQRHAIKGLGFGFGGNYAGEHRTLNRLNIGTFTLPSYTVYNASLSYSADNYSIILKVNNLTNERYFSGWSTITPQNLRNISLSLNYQF